MAITVVGTASNSAINDTDVTVTLPSMSQDDVVYVLGSGGDSASSHSPTINTSGYTTLASFNGSQHESICGRKVQGATPDTTVQIDSATLVSLNGTAACAIVLRGVDTTTPEDATTTTATGTGAPNNAAITTVTDGAEVLAFAAGGYNSTSDSSVTAPSGYSNLAGTGANDNRCGNAFVASKNVTTAGSEDPAGWTDWTNVDNGWDAYTVAVRPDAGGGHTGTSSFTIPSPSVAASGTHPFTGTSSFDAALPSVAASGEQPHEGTSSFDAPLPSVAASGEQPHEGVSSFSVETPSVAASGSHGVGHTGTSNFSVQTPEVAGAGVQKHEGTGTITVLTPEITGIGFLNPEGTALIEVPLPSFSSAGAHGEVETATPKFEGLRRHVGRMMR